MKLNDLLPLGNGSASFDPERLQAWLGTLPYERPGVAAQALMNELKQFAKANSRTRLKLYEASLDTARKLVREVEKQLANSALPLEQDMQLVLIATNALLKSLAAGYAGVADEINHKWIGIGFAKPLRLAVVRAMEFQAQRLDLAYRVYARGSKSAWSEMHRLYRIARNGGFATHKPPEAQAGAEEIYVNALLLDFADPNKLAPGELERVRFYVERHARFALLDDAVAVRKKDDEPIDACFLIKPKDTRAGRSLVRAGKAPIESSDLVLRCNRLLAKLQGQITGIEKGVEPARLGLPLAARQPQYVALMRNLHRLWSAPPMRRFSRQKFKPRVDLVVGLDTLWTYLAGPANRRRTDDLPVKIDTSEWAIGNESPGGFSLLYIAGNAAPVKVGEVVGLRPRDQSTVHLCLTRRVVTGDLQSLELGLQKLAQGGTPTMVSLETTDKQGRKQVKAVRVIVLPRLPSAGDGPALIAPAQAIRPGVSVYLQQRNGPLRLSVTRPIEQSPSCDVFALIPFTPAGQISTAAAKPEQSAAIAG
jgi:cyclic-di-GMP-binding protein